MERRGEEREPGELGSEERLDRARIGRAEGVPDLDGALEGLGLDRPPQRPEGLELGRVQLAEPGEPWPTLEAIDADQPQRADGNAGLGDEREHLDELELVVEVVLEPEDDVVARGERADECRVACLELTVDRRLVAAERRQEARSGATDVVVAARRYGAFVQRVAPGEHGAVESRRAQSAGGRVPVRDVEGHERDFATQCC